MRFTAFKLPETQFEVVKQLAAAEGVPLSTLYREGVRRVVDDRIRRERSDNG